MRSQLCPACVNRVEMLPRICLPPMCSNRPTLGLDKIKLIRSSALPDPCETKKPSSAACFAVLGPTAKQGIFWGSSRPLIASTPLDDVKMIPSNAVKSTWGFVNLMVNKGLMIIFASGK